jgi:hypothetical protein
MHTITAADAPPFWFNNAYGVACSICAPKAMTPAAVEAFANATLKHSMGPWVAVDKSRPPVSQEGRATPHPCEQAPELRTHWFLISPPKKRVA